MQKYFLIFIFFLFITSLSKAENPPEDKSRGVFLAIGVGPRLPLGQFANSSDLGYGFNFELSYTDNAYMPFFLFAKAGFETYPGSQSFYQQSDYSNFSTNALPVNAGIRYYFSPLLENIVLIMPMVEASLGYTYYQKLNQFKPSALKSNFTETSSKIGLSVGGGFSMFIMEILGTYNYYFTNQYIALDIKIRLPLYINL
ncbi:MAG: hypothetical protein P4L27_04725 [Ignavibacteriaceae bacterium]|nr:hypothetical protein [Ignavibacteriaceae bacterium]